LNLKLDEYQKEILAHNGNILLCTGRQVGKTTIFSMKAAKKLINENNCKIIVVSLTEDQAQLIIMMILKYIEENALKLIRKGRKAPTKSRIQLRNGSEVRSRAVGITGNSVRGFTGDVLIVDEAARMPESVWTAAKPTLLTTAGQIWICSTPFGRQGYFYDCYLNKGKRFKVFHISSEEVIKNRPLSSSWTKEQREAAIEFLKQEKEDMSKVRYAQEYLGMFMDDLQQFFPDNLIIECMRRKREHIIDKRNRYFLGVDLARMGRDESTFEIIELKGEQLIHIENQVTKRTLLSQSTKHVIDLNKIYNFEKIFIDDGGIGIGVFDHLLEEESTKRKVIPINNATRVLDYDKTRKKKLLKEDLYNNLLRLMENSKIDLLDDSEVFQSLKSVQYEYTTTERQGQPQLKIFGNYTHIAEGLIRAAWCVKYKGLNIWVKSIKV